MFVLEWHQTSRRLIVALTSCQDVRVLLFSRTRLFPESDRSRSTAEIASRSCMTETFSLLRLQFNSWTRGRNWIFHATLTLTTRSLSHSFPERLTHFFCCFTRIVIMKLEINSFSSSFSSHRVIKKVLQLSHKTLYWNFHRVIKISSQNLNSDQWFKP